MIYFNYIIFLNKEILILKIKYNHRTLQVLCHNPSIIFQYWFPNNLHARSFYTVTNHTNFPLKFTEK